MLIFYLPLHFFKFNTFISHKKYVISKILNSQVIDSRGCARNIKKWFIFFRMFRPSLSRFVRNVGALDKPGVRLMCMWPER